MAANICQYSPLSTISRKEIDARFETVHRNLCYVNNTFTGGNTFSQLFINPTGTQEFKVPFTLFTQTATKTVANTAVETTLFNTGVGSLTIPAGLIIVGRTLRFWITGIHSAIGNPNITINLKVDGVTIATTGAVSSGNSTNAYFEVRAFATCYTTGTSGTIWLQGYYSELGGGQNSFPITRTTALTLDTTIDHVIDVTVTWGTASNSNTITATNAIILIEN